MSPSFNQIILNFCLQNISSINKNFSISDTTSFFLNKDFLVSITNFSACTSSYRIFFCTFVCLKTSSFHFFNILKGFKFTYYNKTKGTIKGIKISLIPHLLHKTINFKLHILEFEIMPTLGNANTIKKNRTMIRTYTWQPLLT